MGWNISNLRGALWQHIFAAPRGSPQTRWTVETHVLRDDCRRTLPQSAYASGASNREAERAVRQCFQRRRNVPFLAVG